MNNGPQEPSDALSPTERRLNEHLELLRTDPPRGSALMVTHIVRTARWQRAVRRPLLAFAALAAAIGEGVRLLLGSRASRS
jgi:hypothetical protein